jgi:hypothetical protein
MSLSLLLVTLSEIISVECDYFINFCLDHLSVLNKCLSVNIGGQPFVQNVIFN